MKPRRIQPGPGQESVWDYPRPPRVEKTSKHVQVIYNDVMIADTHEALRVLETSHPPVYYIPQKDIQMEFLISVPGSSYCEWKGRASYYTVTVDQRKADKAAWYYLHPAVGYEAIKNHVAFYPEKMDACLVDGERVQPQPGGFYGGWITEDVVGPFKGGPGTLGW